MFLGSIAIVALPGAMVFAQPDLGSSLVFAAIWLGMVTVAGANWKHICGLIGAGAGRGAVRLPRPRQRLPARAHRISGSIPEAIRSARASRRCRRASASARAGFFGKGLTHGTQTQLDYLRTQTTDYIFSVLGEELGFVGALVLFALFALLLWRGLRAAELSRDMFGRLLATGIVTSILLQTFINVGVNVGPAAGHGHPAAVRQPGRQLADHAVHRA